MAGPLLKTRLSIPLIRSARVARPRLLARLNDGLRQGGGFGRKLTLVSAPAGYGKTTLVAEWAAGLDAPAVWLSLEQSDNDPVRFLAYLLAALQQIDPDLGRAAQGMLTSPQPPPQETFITALINDLAALGRPLHLVLDDYQVIQNPQVHRAVGFLLDNQPYTLHQVILTREDPLLPVSRLRGRGQVCEIRQDDLRFTPAETAVFLRQVMDINLASQDLATMHRRTEGWVTGLQLAALSMQGYPDRHAFVQSFAGSNRYILDYLFEEILAQQPPDTRRFLLETSILDRLAAGLCAAVTGQSDSRARLEALERANLFLIPLDPAREWYRYHHLFAELLRHQLRLHGEPRAAELHRRAARWYAAEGDLEAAIPHALAARDWGAAAAQIGEASEGLLKRGQTATLIGWFSELPPAVVCAEISFCLTYVWALLLASRFDEAAPWLEQAEEQAPPESAALGQVAAAQAYLARARGDDRRLVAKSRQALALLPESEKVARGNVALNLGLASWHAGRLEEAGPALVEARDTAAQVGNLYAHLTAQIFLARTLATRGKLHQAASMHRALIEEGGNVPILALAHYDLSAIEYEWNRLPQASEHLQRGLELCARSGNTEFQNAGYIQQTFIALAQGDAAGAQQAVERSHALARDFAAPTRARSAACHVQLALALDDLDTAAYWAAQVEAEADAHSFYRFLGLARPRLLLAQGARQAAAEELQACYERASTGGWGYAVVVVRVLQALAAASPEAAQVFLAEALHLARPEGFIRTFVDAGPQLAPLLHEAARRGVEPEYVGRILSVMGPAATTVAPAPAALVEPLSPRELEVLRLVAAGLSNRAIARRLFISLGTVKTHVHNISGKLGAGNRTEAAARAKDLHLI